MDLFGLERERKILKSGVRGVFTPHQPVQSSALFFGRSSEVQKLIEQLGTPGQHALLFGERGVGKSSLANVSSELLLKHLFSGKLVKKRCDADDNFVSVVSPILAEAGINLQVQSTEYQKVEGGQGSLKVPLASASIDTHTTNKKTEIGVSRQEITASWVADKIGDLKALFLIDEVDALSNSDDKRRLAELVKLLSDSGSPLKIILVGIADTSAELVAGHPSVQRCLRETRVGRMQNNELQEIIESGAQRLGLRFFDDATERIISVSSGYAHFTHLLALKAAEDAISVGRPTINRNHVELATRRAVEDAEGTLKRSYDNAARSYGTEEYRKVLIAAALCGTDEIVASELRLKYQQIWDVEISQNSLNNYFRRLVSDDSSSIIRRIAKGVYRFSDPRMPSYVRIAHLSMSLEPES